MPHLPTPNKSAILDNMSGYDFDAVSALARRVNELEETVTKLQEELRKAANFKNDDPNKLVEGIQFLLGRAATVKARERGRRR